ncbi:hypothetical protein HAX54_023854 [Datura stramonium]|uniref:Cyclin N-terminal domain-containing protein n=1 Tax=Datura stramonium TaxID=4076 RepID=A0ABS8RJW6_DATST|nr:hypothetical protein [Datura stramonium]
MKESDIGEDTEDYIDCKLKIENEIAIAGLNSQLSSRITSHGWILQARNTAIDNIVRTGGHFRKITVYTAVVYVDRFLSVMPIQNERFWVAKLLAMACLSLAAEKWEEREDQSKLSELSEYEEFTEYNRTSVMNMKNKVFKEFGGTMTCVTPIHYIKFFLSRFCKDDSRKDNARIITVQVIMSTLGDVSLMCLRPSIVGAAATLLASNPNILTGKEIKDEIDALPPNWLIDLGHILCELQVSHVMSNHLSSRFLQPTSTYPNNHYSQSLTPPYRGIRTLSLHMPESFQPHLPHLVRHGGYSPRIPNSFFWYLIDMTQIAGSCKHLLDSRPIGEPPLK